MKTNLKGYNKLKWHEPQNSLRLSLRPFIQSDITEAYLGWLNEPDVVKYSNQRFSKHTFQSCLIYLETFQNSSNNFLAIIDRESNNMLGTLTVRFSLPHLTADMGIMIGERRVWGQGIGTEAFNSVLDSLEKSKQVRKITSGTLAVNLAMVRILEKAEMELEATRKAQEIFEFNPADVVYYAKFCNY